MGGGATFLRADAERHLTLLFESSELVEIRGMGGRSASFDGRTLGVALPVKGGLFDDPGQAIAAAEALVLEGYAGIYVTLQPLRTSLRARESFGNLVRYGKGEAISAGDVERVAHLLFDLDPVRPSGVCATEEEHAAAKERADAIAHYLRNLGWPDPLYRLDSGNGAHLVYDTRLQRSVEDASRLLARVLRACAAIFDDDVVKLDTSVHNPARVTRLAGCPNRKGRDDEARPWRTATLSAA